MYDESKLDEAKKLIYYSNLIQNGLIDGMRRRGDIGLKLGLVSLVEYRGVMCLVRAESVREVDSMLVDAEKIPEAAKNLSILLKELGSETGLKIDNFAVKNVSTND